MIVHFIGGGGVGPQGPAGPTGPAGAAGAAGADGAQGPVGPAHVTTPGDLEYHDNVEPTRLPVGSEGQMLTIVAGLPTWTTIALVLGMAFASDIVVQVGDDIVPMWSTQ